MRRSAYCRCSTVQNYDYEEAATKLKCKARFLRDSISRLPHQKLGESVAFCDCELALIQAMFSVVPASAEAPTESAPQGANAPAIAALTAIKPSRARRSRAAS
jgi:hypothetical protein